ncbi:STAS domain-containing protein [Streptomyces sp. NPDC085946]|uniref:STAS domain-containing protein n=1 Tax=Streptomyces sp. NPDC085946 TaxID=3365744 RepID=UPI0037D859C3
MAGTDELTGPERLSVTSALVDGVTVVMVKGEIDHHTADPLRQALTPPDGLTRPRTVADLSGVTFMDSSGINALITAHQAHGDEGRLRLAGVRPQVLRVLRLVGVDALIDCYPTLREALAL